MRKFIFLFLILGLLISISLFSHFIVFDHFTDDHIHSEEESDINSEEYGHYGHSHDGSSETEANLYIGQSIDDTYSYQVMYTITGENIIDIKFKLLEDNVEVDDEDITSQLDRLEQYVIGFNKFPTLNNNGLSDELPTITLDMTKMQEAFENAQLRES